MLSNLCYFWLFFVLIVIKCPIFSQKYATSAEILKKFPSEKTVSDKKLLSLQPQNIAKLFTGFYSNEYLINIDSSSQNQASVMICVPIWQQKKNKNKIYWLYLSRCYLSREARPFSQYIYKIEKRRDSLIAQIFTLEKETALSNRFAWLEKQPLAKVKPENLLKSLGCDFLITQTPKGFYIRPLKGDCPLTPPNQGLHSLDLQFFLQPAGVESSVKFFDANNQLIFTNPNQLYERLTGAELSEAVSRYLQIAKSELE